MTRICDCCGREYSAKRATSRFCSDVCRMRMKRSGKAPILRVVEALPERLETPGSLLGATLIALQEAGTLETPGGRLAVSLATRLDDPNSSDSGSAVAALSRELRAVLAELSALKKVELNPLEALRLRRQQAGHAG